MEDRIEIQVESLHADLSAEHVRVGVEVRLAAALAGTIAIPHTGSASVACSVGVAPAHQLMFALALRDGAFDTG